ncbi:Matrixin [Pseudobythopirellula maris]|uniref:Matrixin n=1 Tax=Pseudobythopirellula maris TaxID=2527991 RepID=A0A5C5ZPM4_9BACT|nr:Matrixin [Pseudobythopirellula maris]
MLLVAALAVVAAGAAAEAYEAASRWTTTSHGSTGEWGDPAAVRWSLVPNGTIIGGQGPSDLIAKLDDYFDVTSPTGDLTTRPWFPIFQQSFDRWEELSGLTFHYESNDDGGAIGSSGSPSGQIGVRGDIRIGGATIDGENGLFGYSYFPNHSDMVLDSEEESLFTYAAIDHRQFRNLLMHEIGHGLGLEHVSSEDAAFLLDATLSVQFDGPQHDDLLGVHALYGDRLEKTFGGLGNNTVSTSASLGALAPGGVLEIGYGAGENPLTIDANATDFVSVSNQYDYDYYTFSVEAPTTIDLVLTPLGGVFDMGGETVDSRAASNLELSLIALGGSLVLAEAKSAPTGAAESLLGYELTQAGDYFVRVRGFDLTNHHSEIDGAQLYGLRLTSEATAPALPGDYNGDGFVDSADFTVWRDTRDSSVSPYSGADGDGDGVVGAGDYTVWVDHFGQALPSASHSVPEPSALTLLAVSGVFLGRRRAQHA